MKRYCSIALMLAFGLLIGCGKDDPNSNLKPIEPGGQKPSQAGVGAGGGNAPVMKPAAPPP
jgi:hypothetical protein